MLLPRTQCLKPKVKLWNASQAVKHSVEIIDPVELALIGTKGSRCCLPQYLDAEGLSLSVMAFSDGLHVFSQKLFAYHHSSPGFSMPPHIKESLTSNKTLPNPSSLTRSQTKLNDYGKWKETWRGNQIFNFYFVTFTYILIWRFLQGAEVLEITGGNVEFLDGQKRKRHIHFAKNFLRKTKTLSSNIQTSSSVILIIRNPNRKIFQLPHN